MGVYDRQIATAKRLIAKYGKYITWKSIEEGTPPDLNKPWKPGEFNEVVYPNIKVAFFPIDLIEMEFRHWSKEADVIKGSKGGLMPQVPFTPKLTDLIIDIQEVLTLHNFTPIDVNGEVIMYFLEFNL